MQEAGWGWNQMRKELLVAEITKEAANDLEIKEGLEYMLPSGGCFQTSRMT
jgi:hypothetical protein